MTGQHHRVNEHEFEQFLGECEGQGTLACCSPQGHKESDITQRLYNNNSLLDLEAIELFGSMTLLQNYLIRPDFIQLGIYSD